jgi:hypothetical protein
MASVADYVGCAFGSFTMLQNIGHGAEAEVFVCKHEATGLLYILRLDVSDDALWDREPLMPPRNQSLEAKNAKGTWLVAPRYYFETLRAREKDANAWAIKVPSIYGVLANRYLVPVASPIRVRVARDVDDVLNQTPRTETELFLRACYDVGATQLGSAEEELPSNLLLRLCSCVAQRKMDLKEAQATLRCQHFRINVSFQDIQGAGVVQESLHRKTKESRDVAVLLDFTRAAMTFPPFDLINDSDEFEVREQQPSLDRFNLFLQEHAGVRQEVLTLGES